MRNHIALHGLKASLVLLAVAAAAQAQHYQPFGDLDVEYDLQLWSPPIIDEYGGEPVPPNYGWFADYSRAYLKLSRPESVDSQFQEDGTWGNIWDLGYMTEENHGWLVSILHFNRTSVASLTPVTDIQGNEFTLQNNLNFGTYAGVELNKTFRVHVGEHGSYFEPFGGFRYGKFEEQLNSETLVFDDPANPTMETGTGTRGIFHNSMVGGQLGLRTYTRKGHWIISSEFRGFGLMNFQELHVSQTQIVTTTDGMGGFNVQNPIVTRANESFDEFVIGGELRLEAAYEITREIRAHVGLELMHLGRGLGRGFDQTAFTGARDNDQAATYLGVFFGLQMNR